MEFGHYKNFLGIEVAYTPDLYLLTQIQVVNGVFPPVGHTDDKTVQTPLKLNVKLTPTDGKPLPDPTRYKKIVGSLVYLTT